MTDPSCDEEAIFKVACQIQSPEARALYLKQVCGQDAVSFDRIKALLKVYEEESRFLCAPPPGFELTVDIPTLTEKPGDIIGPYKLLQQIGEGGMGTVY